MKSYMFTKLLPKEVSFVNGESPSPGKLNGIFNQISSAFSFIESFLGNGQDYHISDNVDRKMLFNVSSAIGKTDKLYKPKNRVPDIYRIFRKYSVNNYITYSSAAKAITITNSVVIPAEISSTDKLGIYYIGQANIQIGSGVVTLPLHATYAWAYYSVGSSFTVTDTQSYFYILPNTSIGIKSLYISEVEVDGNSYNTGYSVSLSNDNYYTVKTPCQWSNPAQFTNICDSKTCNYCIGNTYGYDNTNSLTYGTIVCSGAKNQLSAGITYTAESGSSRANLLTLQSPMNTTDNIYSLKLKPFNMHNDAVDTEITTNMCMIYDTKDQVTPIKYTTTLYSAGGMNGNVRGDIFYTNDNVNIFKGDAKRYVIIGGNYGLTDLLYDMMDFMQRPLPTNVEILGPAVYEV